MKYFVHLAFISLLISCGQPPVYKDLNGNGKMEPYENEALSADERIDDILSRLTVDDKINLVVGIGFNIPGLFETIQPLRVPGAVGSTYTFDSLGVNGLITTDGPAGVRILPIEGTKEYFCTAFPIASVLSSTWDTELARQVGAAMGTEVKEYGMDVLLGPALNIHRDPRGGRNFEYFSEDPLVSGKMAAAVINGVQSQGVGTSPKHFVANNQETNRTSVDAKIGERALRELYLRGFEIAVKESNPWTIMSSYNLLNGVSTSQNKELITNILRDEWGFQGFVMTDWFAGTNPVEQMNAGNDLLMPGTKDQREKLKAGIEDGSLKEETLDRNAGRILKILLESPSFNGYQYSNNPDLMAHAKLTRQVAAEGTVLLQNNGVLPLDPTNLTVGTFGNASYDFIAGGTGSGDVNEAYTISLVEGLENIGIVIDEELKNTYNQFIEIEKTKRVLPELSFLLPPPIPERELSQAEVEAIVEKTKIGMITIGRLSGEFTDRAVTGDFDLTKAELDMIEIVSNAYHKANKKVVMILNIGNVIETASWRDKVDAIILPWQGGQEGGNAVVDVLTGKVNPSGKLPTTFPLGYGDVPSANNFPGEEYGELIQLNALFKARMASVSYEEGIYVGYRYYSSFDKEVAYPFGYGMSYTSFEYSDAKVSQSNGNVTITTTVKNTGDVAGKEAVQIYISAPGTTLEQPAQELRAFAKTKALLPGEEQTITVSLQPKDFASFDTDRASWIVEAGEFLVKVGASSEDIKQELKFEIAEEIIVEKLTNYLSPKEPVEELSRQ